MMICFPEHATLVITFSLSALHLPSGLHLFFTLPLAGVSSFSQPPFHTEVQVNRSASSPSFAWLIPLTLHRSAPHAARTHLSKYRRTGKEKTEEARKELKGPSLRLLCTLSAAHWRCSWLHADQPQRRIWHQQTLEFELHWIRATQLSSAFVSHRRAHFIYAGPDAANRRSNRAGTFMTPVFFPSVQLLHSI